MEIKENVKSVKEYNYLYSRVDWGERNKEEVKILLDNTIYSVSIYDEGKIIAYGRIIGDITAFLYIQDVMVDPDYQGKKIGSMVMDKLVDEIVKYKTKYPDLRAYLGASKNKEGFYKKFGFITRDDAGLGKGMVFGNRD